MAETILHLYEELSPIEPDRPSRAFHDILNVFRQRGLLRIEDHGDSRSFTLFLRPALPIVVAEDTLASLEEFVAKSSNAQDSATEGPEEDGAAA